MKHVLKLAAAAAAAMLLAGCASSGGVAKVGPSVGERAVARWLAIIDRKPELAYDYLTPGVRSTITRDVYAAEQGRKPVRYLSVELLDAVCEGDACTVSVELTYELAIQLPGLAGQRLPAFLDERWVRVNGAWYMIPDTFR